MPMRFLYGIVLLGFLSVFACRNDDFSSSPSISLEFSTDTLRLDTVFTERGSATYTLKIFNPSDENVMIQSVKLLDDSGFFRLNVDGINGNDVNDVAVFAKDSIYLFCEVTIDPDQPLSVSPFIIQDRIEFVTNGNQQTVYLEAWGQNANYFPARSNQRNVSLLTCNNSEVIWDDEKPYVIYGVVFIDSCTLRVMAGTEIYVHGGVVSNNFGVYNDGIIFALPKGVLRFEGTLEDPIVIQDDRLEPAFDDVPGQWSGLRFGPASRNHLIEHTIIKNSIVGIQMDSASRAVINNVEIYNTAGAGITAVNANLNITNSLIHNNGGNSISIIHGGTTRITYCTLANFGNENAALSMTNFRCYDALCQVFNVQRLNASVVNSILIGDDFDEINLVDFTLDGPNDFIFQFDNCLYRSRDLLTDNPDFLLNCNGCIENDQNLALFVDRLEQDYHLDTLSQVEGLASPLAIVSLDKDGITRDLTAPDIGCFEFGSQ